MPIFELELLLGSSNLATVFRPLPVEISEADAATSQTLHAAFSRLFRCEAAKARRDVVFVWVVQHPYQHPTGHNKSSHIVYIEKTKATIWARWRTAYFKKLTTDYRKKPLEALTPNLRQFADADRNFTFYGRMVSDHGPLQIWWAAAKDLNVAMGSNDFDAYKWEQLLLAKYRQEHGCRPLKNRNGGGERHLTAAMKHCNGEGPRIYFSEGRKL